MEGIIDTLEITKRFEAAGIERRQAEVFAEVFRKTERSIVHEVQQRDDSYSTKGDIIELKNDIRDLAQVTQSDLKLAISNLQGTLYKTQIGIIVIILGSIGKMLGKW